MDYSKLQTFVLSQEINTGDIWIDGLTIYKKILSAEFSTNISISINLNVTPISQWIDLSNTYISGEYGFRQPWLVGSVTDMYVTNGFFNFKTSHIEGIIYATIKYTRN